MCHRYLRKLLCYSIIHLILQRNCICLFGEVILHLQQISMVPRGFCLPQECPPQPFSMVCERNTLWCRWLGLLACGTLSTVLLHISRHGHPVCFLAKSLQCANWPLMSSTWGIMILRECLLLQTEREDRDSDRVRCWAWSKVLV